MKKASIVFAAIFLFVGISFAQISQTPAKATNKPKRHPTDKIDQSKGGVKKDNKKGSTKTTPAK